MSSSKEDVYNDDKDEQSGPLIPILQRIGWNVHCRRPEPKFHGRLWHAMTVVGSGGGNNARM